MKAYEYKLKEKLKLEGEVIEAGVNVTITDTYPFRKTPIDFNAKKHCFIWASSGHYMIERKYLGEKIKIISEK